METMRNALLIGAVMLCWTVIPVTTIAQQTGLTGPFYPSMVEVKSQIQALAAQYPNIVAYHELGMPQNGTDPVMAVKISDRVSQTEDEPVWVFNGMIHGSEQLGLRIVLDLAKELASGYATNPEIKRWVDAYEIWLVMSINPWGYGHSSGGSSYTLGTRKDGATTSDPNTAGVDLARNYDFRWNQGGSTSPGDYDFRGTAPFSQKSTQAIRDLYLARKPLFGTTFHQGNDPDGGQIMRPWSSSAGSPPDASMLSSYAQQYGGWVFQSRQQGPMCQRLPSGRYALEDPDGSQCGSSESAQYCAELCWSPAQSTLGAMGQPSNWYYAAAGTMEYTVELSDRLFNVSSMHTAAGPQTPRDQTVQAIAAEFAKNHRDAIKSWFAHFLDPSGQFRGPGITGHVRNQRTGAPVSATVEVVGFTSQYTHDRVSDSTFGRYWRLLPAGNHTVRVRAAGYHEWQGSVTVPTSGPLTVLDVALVPEGGPIESVLTESTVGGKQMEIKSKHTHAQSFKVGTAGGPNFEISKVVLYLSRDAVAPNKPLKVSIGTGRATGNLATISIAPETIGTTPTPVEVSFASTALGPLTAGTTYYINMQNKGLNGSMYYVELSTSNVYPDGIYYKKARPKLNNDARFQVWGISGSALASIQPGDAELSKAHTETPTQFELSQNYPNPFNPETTIGYRLPVSGHVRIVVYDVMGRLQATLIDEAKGAGSYTTQWNAAAMPNGMYLYRIDIMAGAEHFSETRKMILLK